MILGRIEDPMIMGRIEDSMILGRIEVEVGYTGVTSHFLVAPHFFNPVYQMCDKNAKNNSSNKNIR